MKHLIPFMNIKSVHLSVVLSCARAMFLVSVLCFIVLVLGVTVGPFLGYSAIFFLGTISVPVTGLVLSALLAALVAFEEGFRQRTEQLVGQERRPI